MNTSQPMDMDVNCNYNKPYTPTKTKESSEKRFLTPTKSPTTCTCRRLDTTILCKMCGFLLTGRTMQSRCPIHPKVVHLMDHSHCPHCHSTNLQECESLSPVKQ